MWTADSIGARNVNNMTVGISGTGHPGTYGRSDSNKRLYLRLAAGILIVSVAWFLGHPRGVSISGNTVAYWLDQVPSPREGALLPKDNPLTRAGPEIIPELLAAIGRRYATREVIKRYSRFIPKPFHKPLGMDLPSGSEVHGYAAYRLGLMGEAASNAVPTLLELLKFHRKYTFDGDRARIIQALGFIGPPASGAASSLVRELQNPNDWVKRTTARTLLRMGTVPSEAVPFLKENLCMMEVGAGVTAVALIAAEETPANISRVSSMLTNETPTRLELERRLDAATSLTFLKSVPSQLKTILEGMLDDDDTNVRQAAAIGLARPNEEILPRIIELLMERLINPRLEVDSAEALGRIGPQAKRAISALQIVDGYVSWNIAREAQRKIEPAAGGNAE
jgi:HEAT repeat protein